MDLMNRLWVKIQLSFSDDPIIIKCLSQKSFHAIFHIEDKDQHERAFFSRFKDIAPNYDKFKHIRLIHDYILQSANEKNMKIYENTDPQKTSSMIIKDILEFAKRHT